MYKHVIWAEKFKLLKVKYSYNLYTNIHNLINKEIKEVKYGLKFCWFENSKYPK